MSSKLALTVGAIAALIFGLALSVAPAQMLAGFGLGVPTEAEVLSRDVGVTLLGLALINWMARDATGRAVRAILIGNLFIQIMEFLVNGGEIAAGSLPVQAASGLVIHLALGVVFALGLRRAA